MNTYLYRASNLKCTITFLKLDGCRPNGKSPAWLGSEVTTWTQFDGGSQFLVTTKTHCYLQFIHDNNNNNYHQHLQTGFLRVY